MPKFTATERSSIQSIVATLSLKRVPDTEIIEEISQTIKKTITRREIYNVRNRIKKDSFKWFVKLRDNEYEYLHEYKERINELNWLYKKHHEIVDQFSKDPTVVQNSLAQLHKLNTSLTESYNYLPNIIPLAPVTGTPTKKEEEQDNFVPLICTPEEYEKSKLPFQHDNDDFPEAIITVEERERQLKGKPLSAEGETRQKETETNTLVCYCDEGQIMCHYECPTCHHIWCPENKAAKQLLCPKCVPIVV